MTVILPTTVRLVLSNMLKNKKGIAGAYSSQSNHQEPVLYDRTNSIHSNHAVPSHTETVPTTTYQENMCEEFSKFMVKKDMFLKRIHEFDDRPCRVFRFLEKHFFEHSS